MDRLRHLQSLLSHFEPANPREAEFCRRMVELSTQPGEVMDRHHFEPGHFTASAFVVSAEGSRVLLILHGKLHIWVQPGGHIDGEDADVVAAALREVVEETGIPAHQLRQVGAGLFDVDIHPIPARKGDPEHHHYDLRILLRALTDQFEAGSDARAGQWVKLEEVPGLATDESVLRAVRKIQQLKAEGSL